MQDQSVIRNFVAEKGWRILSLEETPVTDTIKGKEGGITLKLDTGIPKCPDVSYISIPNGISGHIKNGVIRTFVPRDIISLIKLLPSIMNQCSGYSYNNQACPIRRQCQLNKVFYRKVRDRELEYGLRNPFIGSAPFTIKSDITVCSSYLPDDGSKF